MEKTIIITGSIAFDYIFDIENHFSDYIQADKIHSLNFSIVTETFKKSYGGTAGNQAFYLGVLGACPKLLASVGYDFLDYKAFLEKNNINTTYIQTIEKEPTAMGFVITDKKDNQIWMFSKGAMKHADKIKIKKYVKDLKNTFVVISPNEPKALINLVNECAEENIEFAFDPAFYVPTLPIDILKKGIESAKIIFGNDYEVAFMEKRLGINLPQSLKPNQILVKTLADQGSEIICNKKMSKAGIFKTKTVDPTGAGDAYRAGFIYGYLNNQPIDKCAMMGAVTASFAVEIKGTINVNFSKDKFEDRLLSMSLRGL